MRQRQSFGPRWSTRDALPPRGNVRSGVEEILLPVCNVEQHVGVGDMEQVRQSEVIPGYVLQVRKRGTNKTKGHYESMNDDRKVAKWFVRGAEAAMYELVDVV